MLMGLFFVLFFKNERFRGILVIGRLVMKDVICGGVILMKYGIFNLSRVVLVEIFVILVMFVVMLSCVNWY